MTKKRMLFGTLAAAAASVAIAMPATASATEMSAPDAVVAPCHPSHDPLMECVRKTLETITSAIAPLPDPARLCEEVFGRPCATEETAAAAATPTPAVCGSMKPVECVIYYLTLWDPCLLCGSEDAARRE